jgi:hypothetical protein
MRRERRTHTLLTLAALLEPVALSLAVERAITSPKALPPHAPAYLTAQGILISQFQELPTWKSLPLS